MLEFKPEDFESERIGFEMELEECAKLANAKFKEWVESQEMVYQKDGHKDWLPIVHDATHTARIFDIKPIETECEHQNTRSHLDKILTSHPPQNVYEYYCMDCGKKLKPTGWEVVE